MKTTISLLVLFGLVLGGGYWYNQHQQAAEQAVYTNTAVIATTTTASTTSTGASASTASGDSTPTASATPGSYTLAQVSTHNTSGNCWAAIDGKVYNLTDWINKHPGGAARILTICGKDGSPAFDKQHGSDDKAQEMLAEFKIGILIS